jgi:hypothetical protein
MSRPLNKSSTICSLPISAEIHRLPALHRHTRSHVNLRAIADSAMVFTP